MSRYYEMTAEVKGYNKDKEEAIRDAFDDEWGVDDSWIGEHATVYNEQGQLVSGVKSITFNGRNSLVGGEGEDEFACRLCRAIWRANEAFCDVEVRCVYLDDPPTEIYAFGEEAYEAWKEAQCPSPSTTS